MKRVTGIGGIFFKAKDSKALAKWYEDHLGINFGNNLYCSFSWRKTNSTFSATRTDLSIFSDKSDYFDPSKKQLMLNLQVENLEELLKVLKEEKVDVQDKIDRYAYGNFGWLMDPEGNKIELWEPIESGFGEEEKIISERMKSMTWVTGIGGIFFMAENQQQLQQWYEKHLGITLTSSGHTFEWTEFYAPEKKGNTVFSIFKNTTKYLQPSAKEFMINFRVKNLESLFDKLKKENVTLVGEIEKYDYGNFGWIMDPEGNKIELWESID